MAVTLSSASQAGAAEAFGLSEKTSADYYSFGRKGLMSCPGRSSRLSPKASCLVRVGLQGFRLFEDMLKILIFSERLRFFEVLVKIWCFPRRLRLFEDMLW